MQVLKRKHVYSIKISTADGLTHELVLCKLKIYFVYIYFFKRMNKVLDIQFYLSDNFFLLFIYIYAQLKYYFSIKLDKNLY